MRRLRVIPVLLVLLGFCGCQSKGPDKQKPWVVVLDETATRVAAERRAAELAEAHPEMLDGAGALSVLEKIGVVRHLAVSRGFSTRQEAEAVAKQLGASGPQLQVISITGLRLAGEKAYADASAPEEVEFIEKLAASLPAPAPGMELHSFLLLKTPDKADRYQLGNFGRCAPVYWERKFARLGWNATAEATYRKPGSLDDADTVRILVGWLNPGADHQDMLNKTYTFLWDYLSPTEEEWEQIEKEQKQKRKQRRQRRKRRRRKQPEEPEVVETRTVPEPVDAAFWWGPAKVHPVERVTFVPRLDTDADTPMRTAWIASGPEKQAMIVVLFENPELVKSLMAPRIMGKSAGLAHSVYLKNAWQVLPDVVIEEEEMIYVGMDRFGSQLDRKRRRLDWAKAHSEVPVIAAGYADKQAWWGVSWVDLGSPGVAEAVFDSAFVASRKEKLQRMLKSRRGVNYDMGVSLHEVGDATMAWHFKGAARGHMQELYFRTDSVLWLLKATQSKKGPMQPQDLLARVDLLQIWDEPEE